MASMSVFDRVRTIPQPNFSTLAAGPFLAIFEEDRSLALQSEDQAAQFVDQATDVEAMLMMSEVSLRAPLNEDGYKLMMHLCHKVFTRMGIPNIPDFVEGAQNLDSNTADKLVRFKRDIRAKQGRLKQKDTKDIVL